MSGVCRPASTSWRFPVTFPRCFDTVKVTTLFTYTTPHTSNGLQVSVSTGATVTGKVTNATTSEPVTGAVVQVTDADGTISSQPTGTNGEYTLAGMVPSTSRSPQRVPESSRRHRRPSPSQLPPRPPTTSALAAGGTITGTIHPSGGGAPPPGTTVAASGQGKRVSGYAGTVSPAGTFTISGLPAGTYAVVAEGTGTLVGDQGDIVVSGSGTTGGIALTLGLGASVHGTVTDATTGDPVAGAEVQSHGLGESHVARRPGLLEHTPCPGWPRGLRHCRWRLREHLSCLLPSRLIRPPAPHLLRTSRCPGGARSP